MSSSFQCKLFRGLFTHLTWKKLIYVQFGGRGVEREGEIHQPMNNSLWTSFKTLVLLWWPLNLHNQMPSDHITPTVFYHISLTHPSFQDIPSLRSPFFLECHFTGSRIWQQCLSLSHEPVSLGGSRHILAYIKALEKKTEKSLSSRLFWICLCSVLCGSLLCSVLCIRWKAIILPEMYL